MGDARGRGAGAWSHGAVRQCFGAVVLVAALPLVAALAVACSTQTPAPPDAAAADAGPSPAQAACEAAGEPCRAFVWQDGQCTPKALVGAVCGEIAGACTVGVCDEAGQCTDKQPAAVGKVCSVVAPAACQKGLGRCDSGGNCIPEVFEGATCKVGDGPCAGAGKCNDQGQCVAGPVQGTSCQLNEGPCGKGICNAQGKCASTVTGQPCSAKVGPCEVALCDANGACTAQPQPAGTACKVGAPKSCESTSGKCDAAAKCVADIAVGEACKVGGNVCSLGACNAQGGCDATEFAVAGTSCGPDVGCGVPLCDGKGGCVATPTSVGKPCSGKSPIACSKHTCNAAGQCELVPASGEVCSSSKKGAPYCFLEGAPECKQPVCTAKLGHFNLVPTPGKTCKATSACTVGVCDASGACSQVPGNEGLKCPLPASVHGECAYGACQNGSCALTIKAGAACGNDICKVGTCDAKGACVQVPTPGKTCGAEGQCSARICSASGTCEEVATPGKSCPSKGACFAGVCDAAKACAQIPKPGATCQTIGLCGNGVCNSTGGCVDPAWPDPPPCMIAQAGVFGECWTGVKDGSGGCKKVAKVGASCGCWVSPCSIGTCQADGSCLQKPNKPVGAACSSECVAGGTCDATGLCAGPVAMGAACTPYADSDWSPAAYDCASYSCKHDGTCAASPKPAGSPCAPGYAYVSKPGLEPCGAWNSCDGKGRCVAEASPWGNYCGGGSPCSLSQECVSGQCLTRGQDPDGAPCTKGCFSGRCTAGLCAPPGDVHDAECGTVDVCETMYCCGPFGLPGLTGTTAQCIYGGTGSCLSEYHLGKQCGSSQNGCFIGTCVQAGYCYFGKAAFGKKCGSSDPCDDLACIGEQCLSAAQFGYVDVDCDDGNPCTSDYPANKCLCFHSESTYLEGKACAPGAHCIKGNCVPD